jgi:hypothetical protein
LARRAVARTPLEPWHAEPPRGILPRMLIEACRLVGARGPVARGEQSCRARSSAGWRCTESRAHARRTRCGSPNRCPGIRAVRSRVRKGRGRSCRRVGSARAAAGLGCGGRTRRSAGSSMAGCARRGVSNSDRSAVRPAPSSCTPARRAFVSRGAEGSRKCRWKRAEGHRLVASRVSAAEPLGGRGKRNARVPEGVRIAPACVRAAARVVGQVLVQGGVRRGSMPPRRVSAAERAPRSRPKLPRAALRRRLRQGRSA